jgi:hypothetical protein
MTRPAEGRELALERADFRTENELAMGQYARDGVIDGAAEPAALRSNIDERDRPLVQTGVLIHGEILGELLGELLGEVLGKILGEVLGKIPGETLCGILFFCLRMILSEKSSNHGCADDAPWCYSAAREKAPCVSRQRMAISRLATPSSPVTAGARPSRMASTKARSSARSGSA